ncbi:PTS transporter subunit EIIC [Spiroplasma culicicola]|uniref:PTS system beta-glucoside-specific IIABC component n=1 Tax=Spiroplasma culicicola AES-1 TaxID=1276246 RepID=W6A7Q9_9MOLU|nr:PTS transporter subunit EIIC [Spiroplasma culicicola]AHI53173.1 PTS system beta-glucoside-specific IIABC component [Spiroplasma culicicola AES-1]
MEERKNIHEIKGYKSKFLITSEKLIELVGKQENFSKVYNCVTRIRFLIINPDLVKIDEIKKIELVKGINWNGNELQIIIGNEVAKVKEQIDKVLDGSAYFNLKNNLAPSIDQSFGKKILQTISGIMTPLLPILMAVGLIAALQSILVETKVIENVATLPGDYGIFEGLIFIFSKVSINLLGVMFCYSTAKYFKGNTIIAIGVGLTLTSRMLYGATIVPIEDAQFGDWVQGKGSEGWLLFKLGDFPILIRSYEGSILPFILAGILVALLDKWVKQWIPSLIDLLFRPLIVYTLALIPILFLFGPIIGFIELGFANIVLFVEKWPLGIGPMLFAFLYQILVLTGVHVAVGLTISIPTIFADPQVPTAMMTAFRISVFGQLGAIIAIIIITKNYQLKTYSIGTIATGIFGISEPMIYGATLPRVKPFLAGCAGAGVAGLFIGLLKIEQIRPAGLGVFNTTGMDGTTNQILFLVAAIIAIGSGLIFTLLIYQEKKNEIKYTKKIFNSITNLYAQIISASTSEDKKTIKEKVKTINNEYIQILVDNKKTIEDYFNYIKYETKLTTQLDKIIQKEERIRNSLYKKAIKAEKLANKKEEVKINQAIDKYNQFNLDNQKDILIKQINDYKKQNTEIVNNFNALDLKLTKIKDNIFEKYVNLYDIKGIEEFKNELFNALWQTEITFGNIDEKNNMFNAKFKKGYKKIINDYRRGQINE